MKINKLFFMAGLVSFICLSFVNVSDAPKDVANSQKSGGETFIEFLSHFEKVDLPFSYGLSKFDGYDKIGRGKLSKINNRSFSPISSSGFIPDTYTMLMGRMGRPTILPIARFYPSENMVAVVYSVESSFSSGISKDIKMICYDLQGNILNEMEKGDLQMINRISFSSPEKTATCTIDENGYVWINTYENCWRENVRTAGIRNNELLDFNLTNTDVFKINEKGAMIQLGQYPITTRASLN